MRVLVLLVATLGYVSAFAEPGAYERLWYYYTYLIDHSSNGGVATKYAVGCAKELGTGGKPCSFNQFIQYINADSEAKNFDVTSENRPHVGNTARTLIDKGLTGAYNVKKIRPTLKTANVASLMSDINGFLEGKLDDVDEDIKHALQHSTSAVARTRMAASLESLKDYLDSKGIEMVKRDVPIFDGARETTEELDYRQTVQHNNIDNPKDLRDKIMTWREDDNHASNIKAARYGASVVSRACIAGKS